MSCHGLVTICTCLILIFKLYRCCTFDQIQINSINLPHAQHFRSTHRQTRSTHGTFSPIRLHVHYSNLSAISEETQRLQEVVNSAVSKITSLLSVIPVEGPLWLQRKEACGGIHVGGPNLRKCSHLKPNYSGEFCKNKVDRFKIPEEHLLGIDIYSKTDALPNASSLPNGTGIKNADFILYVNSRFSRWCQEQNMIAYSSYCQLDRNDRPIAGFVNFCPIHLSTSSYSRLNITMTAVHEIFHTLGFSHHLFSKYKECQYSPRVERQCFPRKEPYEWDENTWEFRILLPSVIREASQHFGCHLDLGVPLDKSEFGISSHWDPLVMHNSIMAPSFKQPQEVSIDPITLSVFADSGWYQVNYSAADTYSWAKDAGCDFLESFQCSEYPFLCNTSLINEFGCAKSSQGIAECVLISAKHSCGIFKQNKKLCCKNSIHNISSLPFTPSNRVTLETSSEPSHEDNETLVTVPLAFPTPKDIERLGFNTSELHHLALQKIFRIVCPISHWFLRSSLQVYQANDSYLLHIWINAPDNTTDDQLHGVIVALQNLAQHGNFTLDAEQLQVTPTQAAVPSRSGHKVFLLRGWEALAVVAGIAGASLFLAVFIVTFLQVKARILHKMGYSPSNRKRGSRR